MTYMGAGRWLLVSTLTLGITGCGWWDKRKAKADLEKVHDDAKAALSDLAKVDADVLDARKALKRAKGDTGKLVEAIHDYAVALGTGVKPAKKLAKAIGTMNGSKVTMAMADEIEMASVKLTGACDHNLKFDEIDTCGGAWGGFVHLANVFAEYSTLNDVPLPRVRKNGDD